MGVIAICLSIGTLFGMVFNTTWARHFPIIEMKKIVFWDTINFGKFLLLILLIFLCLKLIPYLASIFSVLISTIS